MVAPPSEATPNPLAIRIRRMKADDVSPALAILQESPEASPWSKPSLLASLADGAGWVAERDGRVEGVLISRQAADEFEILNLAVGKNSRRIGIATQLVKSALEQARKSGATRIHLEMRASNEAAMGLYSNLGFRNAGCRRNYYSHPAEDAVLLVLRTPA